MKGITYPSFPHSLGHVHASTATTSLRSSIKKAVFGKHGPPENQTDRPRIYSFSGYRLNYNIAEIPRFVKGKNKKSRIRET